MSSAFNNSEMKAMTYNDQKVKEWYHDGVLVYRSATPYYVSFTDYPITKTSSANDDGTARVLTDSSGYTLSTGKDAGTIGFGAVEASVSLPTQGCNKVRVSYTRDHCTGLFMSDVYLTTDNLNSITDGSYAFDCSGDMFELFIQITQGSDNGTARFKITEIYFYSE